MLTKEIDVKSATAVVGTAEYSVFDSVAEAVEAQGEESVLAAINAQNKTNAMNTVRAAATGKPSKKALRTQAAARATGEQWAAVAGDITAIENMLVGIERDIEAELAAKQELLAATVADTDNVAGADESEDDD